MSNQRPTPPSNRDKRKQCRLQGSGAVGNRPARKPIVQGPFAVPGPGPGMLPPPPPPGYHYPPNSGQQMYDGHVPLSYHQPGLQAAGYPGVFTFQDPISETIIIDDAFIYGITNKGSYNISETPNGTSKITLEPHFLSVEEADMYFKHLKENLDWQQRINETKSGETYKEPRKSIWFGEHPYTYSKVSWNANKEWDELLLQLKEKIEAYTKTKFNSVLCNLYRDNRDSIAWHSDDEYGLGKNPRIASLSLGATRKFEMMTKKCTNECATKKLPFGKKLRIPVTHGSLLIMEEATQCDWLHQIPKEVHERTERINLTFRTIYQDNRDFTAK